MNYTFFKPFFNPFIAAYKVINDDLSNKKLGLTNTIYSELNCDSIKYKIV